MGSDFDHYSKILQFPGNSHKNSNDPELGNKSKMYQITNKAD